MLPFSRKIVHAFHYHKENYTAMGSFHSTNFKQMIIVWGDDDDNNVPAQIGFQF